MPQLQLPIFQEGTHLITENLGYRREDGQVSYLHGMMPVFIHDVEDTASFQMIVSQFYINGNAKQSSIVKAFGINALALKRWVKKYREDGPKAFYIEKRGRPRSPKKRPNKIESKTAGGKL
ncbi:MAG: helix-turn-helix domain-containing protein [Bacteroidetes bacterium]|nr:helix-turn-helix domain-containing protein [Bacteroidota bacterium]